MSPVYDHPALHITPVPADWSRKQTFDDLKAMPEGDEKAAARKGMLIARNGLSKNARRVLRSHAIPDDSCRHGTRLVHMILVDGWWYHYRDHKGPRAHEAFRVPYTGPID